MSEKTVQLSSYDACINHSDGCTYNGCDKLDLECPGYMSRGEFNHQLETQWQNPPGWRGYNNREKFDDE